VPGGGKYYCIPCARYFAHAAAQADHERGKPHKRRAKLLAAAPRPHNQLNAELAAGVGKPDNGPRLRSASGGGAGAVVAMAH
jgi:bud site selection protein 20